MKILVAVEKLDTRWWLQTELLTEGDEVLAVGDGFAVWEALCSAKPPQVVLIDRELPGWDGLEVCRKARGTPLHVPPYLIVLLERGARDANSVLQAGADDYLRTPFDPNELTARINVARRVMRLQAEATACTDELYNSLLEPEPFVRKVLHLNTLLPQCAWCKRVRSDESGWQELGNYLADRLEVEVTHGICPDCVDQMLATQNAESEAVLPQRLQAS